MELFIERRMHKQSGIALIQVLLISTLITLLAMHFTYTAREQIAISSALEQRAKASQKLKSVQNKIIFSLLTINDFEQESEVFPQSEPWNFYGKPFYLEQNEDTQVLIAIQDNSGLLSQHYIKSPHWTKAFTQLGLSINEITRKQGLIQDWQDKDKNSWIIGNLEPNKLDNGQQFRNQAIQLAQEIEWFFEDDRQKLNLLKKISTPYSVVAFNPMNAPDVLLSLYFTPEIAAEIIRQRENSLLTRSQIKDYLGSDYNDVIITLLNGTQFKIIIQINFKDVKLQETLEVQLQPSEREPILILARY
ncbi:MAG: general secretion pathway protein K [Psychroserpens sp.]|jgi:general secretion pathway protein K